MKGTQPADSAREGSSAPEPRPAPQPAAAPVPFGQPITPQPDAPPQRWWLTLLILAVLAGGGWFAWPKVAPYLLPQQSSKGPPPPRVIPVVTAQARKSTLQLSLNGLGTVTGYKTVTVRSRVEGELTDVAFTEGQMVDEGDLLAQVDPRPFEAQLKEAEAQLARDEAAQRAASSDYERSVKLFQSKNITQADLDTQRALMQGAKATVQLDESRIESIRLQLAYCRITAPLTGRIGLRNVDSGNMVRANDPTGIATITQVQPIAVVFSIPQDEISRIQKELQTRKELAVEAYDRGFLRKLAYGNLAAIDNQVDPATGTLRLKAVFENRDGLLFPNQFVNVRLQVETLTDVVVIPSAGVQRGPDSHYVYVVKPDDTVDLKTIEPGPTEGDQTVIEHGLAPGETVVIDGVDKLQKGTKVTVRDQPGRGKRPAAGRPAAGKPQSGTQVARPAISSNGTRQRWPGLDQREAPDERRFGGIPARRSSGASHPAPAPATPYAILLNSWRSGVKGA